MAVPTAIVVALAILVLGEPLGALLYPNHPFHYWSGIIAQGSVLPEPTEQARFLISLTAPVLLVAGILALIRRPLRLRPQSTEDLVTTVQAIGLFFLIVCFVVQRTYVFGVLYTSAATAPHTVYFTIPTLLVAALLTAGITSGIRSPRVRERFQAWCAHSAASRGWQVGAAVFVVAIVAITVLPAINTDDSIGTSNQAVAIHLAFTFDEAMSVVDGRSPIGNFAAQYGSLWPYLAGAVMSIFGASLLAFTTTMAAVNGAVFVGLYGIVRRLTRTPLAALLVFVPLLATCAYMARGPATNRYALINYFGTFPLRYAGPLLLAWLLARHLDGAWPRRAWPLFVLGGLVMLNNVDFGVAALGATAAALVWTRAKLTVQTLRPLALEAGLGLAGAIGLVSVFLLVRTGSPPDFGLVSAYARVFAVGGFSMLPMRPVIGMSTVIYLTYVAAIGTATVRALRGEADRLLTGLLVWSGIFGLGAGAYYMGRSHPEVLTNMFPAWAFAVTLLTIATVRHLAERWESAPSLPAIACLFGFGILVCSVAQTPTPWPQVARIREHAIPGEFRSPAKKRFIAAHTRPGEHVVLLMQLSHRIAAEVGIVDVTPYTAVSIITKDQLTQTIAVLRDEGGHKIFIDEETQPELTFSLTQYGFHQSKASTEEIGLWTRGPAPA